MEGNPLLVALARVHPEVWDLISPRSPVTRAGTGASGLGPQALPPVPANAWVAPLLLQPVDESLAYQLASAHLAHEIARLAIADNVRGDESVGTWVRELIDDWCGTPWPRKWPWPWPGPRPGEGPLPEPWVIAGGRAVAAVVLAGVGVRLADDVLAVAFTEGALRLAEAG